MIEAHKGQRALISIEPSKTPQMDNNRPPVSEAKIEITKIWFPNTFLSR